MPQLSKEDFASKHEVKWCPGCGDYAILSTLQKTLPEFNIPKENIVFISGIGCSGRLPYYMNTYGFHTLHGRAPAIATGLKLARPELSVWLVTGDGDALSIGSNHLLHILRRNLDVKILLINNRVYGLTKGQYSPTSEKGKRTVTSPQGSKEEPVNPISFALAAGATFVARALDVDSKGLSEVLKAAIHHKGTAFIEIYQSCHIFNPDAFTAINDKKSRPEQVVYLQEGMPLIFGNANNKGIKLSNLQLEVVDLDKAPQEREHLLTHNPENEMLAYMLSKIDPAKMPIPFGIFRRAQKDIFETSNLNTKIDLEQLKNLLQARTQNTH